MNSPSCMRRNLSQIQDKETYKESNLDNSEECLTSKHSHDQTPVGNNKSCSMNLLSLNYVNNQPNTQLLEYMIEKNGVQSEPDTVEIEDKNPKDKRGTFDSLEKSKVNREGIRIIKSDNCSFVIHKSFQLTSDCIIIQCDSNI